VPSQDPDASSACTRTGATPIPLRPAPDRAPRPTLCPTLCLTLLLVLCPVQGSPSTAVVAPDCEAELDRHVADARAGHTERAERGLLELAAQCNQLPQIRHGLGSLAARRGDWDGAIAHLEAAIALDARTADTVESLRAIQRWRAASAYAEALGEPAPPLAPPVPGLHDSRRVDSGGAPQRVRDGTLRDEGVLDAALESWWSSATGARAKEHGAHYAAGFRGDALAASALAGRRPDWKAVVRDIVFTREDAVALVRWNDGTGARHERLLSLRAQDGRWTIYQERAL